MRILHTMLRVVDLDKAIQFYTEVLGMTLFSRNEFPAGKFTLAFVGYDKNSSTIELTHNWETDSYELGNAYGHVALEVDDVYDACDRIKAAGGEVVREAGPMKHGSTILAFVKDPDGYMIELLGK